MSTINKLLDNEELIHYTHPYCDDIHGTLPDCYSHVISTDREKYQATLHFPSKDDEMRSPSIVPQEGLIIKVLDKDIIPQLERFADNYEKTFSHKIEIRTF